MRLCFAGLDGDILSFLYLCQPIPFLLFNHVLRFFPEASLETRILRANECWTCSSIHYGSHYTICMPSPELGTAPRSDPVCEMPTLCYLRAAHLVRKTPSNSPPGCCAKGEGASTTADISHKSAAPGAATATEASKESRQGQDARAAGAPRGSDRAVDAGRRDLIIGLNSQRCVTGGHPAGDRDCRHDREAGVRPQGDCDSVALGPLLCAHLWQVATCSYANTEPQASLTISTHTHTCIKRLICGPSLWSNLLEVWLVCRSLNESQRILFNFVVVEGWRGAHVHLFPQECTMPYFKHIPANH